MDIKLDIQPGLIQATMEHEYLKDIERFRQTVYFRANPDDPIPEKAYIYPKELLEPGIYGQKVASNTHRQGGKTLSHRIEYVPMKSQQAK